TPIAIILVMVLGAMAMANRIIENCGNTLILRCSGSENGGTSQFASRLIGEREVVRRQKSHAHDRDGWLGSRSARRSTTISRQQLIESAVLAAEIEQLPDLHGFLKTAGSPLWLRVRLRPQS
ncbi:MAG: type IV secretion system DNA-binding domain-containing protein, partial [Gammaproteobacteria bacterium]|nr:type IV secretion system DNA-binding domain-containing protein [Gammaproteobacteria bacterium]